VGPRADPGDLKKKISSHCQQGDNYIKNKKIITKKICQYKDKQSLGRLEYSKLA